MTTTNVTSEKVIAQNKINAIEKSKAKIKNSENDFFANTDSINLEKLVSKLKVTEKNNGTKKLMYKFEKTDVSKDESKKLRTKYRNIRNRYANNVILHFQKKEKDLLLNEIKNFKEFYLKTYILNDFSLLSLSSNNRDKETETLLNAMLQIIQLIK